MSGSALIYDKEMTRYKLLWTDPVCEIETPERLMVSYEALKSKGLEQRCESFPIREATEEEILLAHSKEYLEAVKQTPHLSLEELRTFTQQYSDVYFHPNIYHCAKMAVGATIQLVDNVMTGKVRNGMALVRPPGHHSQRNAANGFCVFNNVAIAAVHAKNHYNLSRILIVDWDIHHGQGVQYCFEEDPSVLYFSWHRYEHRSFWPYLAESDFDGVGKGKGAGFNINLPWNKVGMTNSDYLYAFFQVLLPVAYEGHMCASPEIFGHLTHLLMSLAKGRLCVVLEGGYNMSSLAQSVCQTVQTLLGDPTPVLASVGSPCHSALESVQNVRAVHQNYWNCFKHIGEQELLCVRSLSFLHFPQGLHDRASVMQAVLCLLLPMAYEFDPGLVVQVLGKCNSKQEVPIWAQLTSLLQGLAQGKTLALLQVSTDMMVNATGASLSGSPGPSLGPLGTPLAENMEALEAQRQRLKSQWGLLLKTGVSSIFNDFAKP
uniref:Histone deacetylase domain-containing protein n=1 Tax=Electrophorus electricus TaxID=8005 RepID=A0A4W4E4U0_ELEEL